VKSLPFSLSTILPTILVQWKRCVFVDNTCVIL
jgi:hypothetical protein